VNCGITKGLQPDGNIAAYEHKRAMCQIQHTGHAKYHAKAYGSQGIKRTDEKTKYNDLDKIRNARLFSTHPRRMIKHLPAAHEYALPVSFACESLQHI
jgi:hypothetical protein